MDLMNMSKKEYMVFRLIVNISFLAAIALVFFIIEVHNIKYQIGFIPGLVPVLILSTIFLLLGLLTIFPQYKVHIGKSLMILAVTIFSHDFIQILYWRTINLIIIIEIITAITIFIYGLDMKSGRRKLISLKALAGHEQV